MSTVSAGPVVALMAFGVLLAIAGSAMKSTTVQATGLAILFLATAAMVVGAFVAFSEDERDPRPTAPRAVRGYGSGGSARPAARIRSPAAARAAAATKAAKKPQVIPTG